MSKNGIIISYEVFITHISPAYEMHGQKFEESEWFPSWNEVGIKKAQSCISLAIAKDFLKEWHKDTTEKETLKIDGPKELILPSMPTFTLKDILALNSLTYPNLYIKIKELVKDNKLEICGESKNVRGRPSKIFRIKN